MYNCVSSPGLSEDHCHRRITLIAYWVGEVYRKYKSVKRIVDRTAPCGRPEGVALGDEDASFKCTVKVRPSKNVLKRKSKFVGSLRVTSLSSKP